MIEGAVVSSLRKHVGKNADIRASIDRESGQFSAVVVKKVVDVVVEPELEMTAADAQKIGQQHGKACDEVVYPAPASDFALARIAAQTAKQVLTQRVREVERDKLYEEFKPKEGEVVTGAVHRFLDRNIIIDLGKTEAILPLREQIRRERYGIGSNVRAVILRVDKAQRGPAVVLSRASESFLQRLMELEIPEIGDKTVEIVHLVRDPGFPRQGRRQVQRPEGGRHRRVRRFLRLAHPLDHERGRRRAHRPDPVGRRGGRPRWPTRSGRPRSRPCASSTPRTTSRRSSSPRSSSPSRSVKKARTCGSRRS